jgi:hypothetical protein
MPNAALEDKKYPCPDDIIHYLNTVLSKYKNETESKGYKRIKGIIEKKELSYPQMKNIKSYFDNFEGDKGGVEYNLHGGDKMKNWVIKELNTSIATVYNPKVAQKNIGMENRFKKTHTKDKDNADPTRITMTKLHKGSVAKNIMSNSAVSESTDIYKEIEAIKYLIEYMENNNKNKLI